MLKCLEYINWKKTDIFATEVASGTAGVRISSSKDAKKVYTNYTAAVLWAEECMVRTVSTVQENAEDIYVDTKVVNEERTATGEATEFDSLNDIAEETLYETLNETETAAEQ